MTFRSLHVVMASVVLGASLLAPAMAQTRIPEPVYRCDIQAVDRPPLKVFDNASVKGVPISNTQLITLHNGMKAVSFSAAYAEHFFSDGPRKVRFTVSWFDDCGRPVSLGTNVADGFVINPGQYLTRQSVAPTRDASIAEIRFYVESSPVTDPYRQ